MTPWTCTRADLRRGGAALVVLVLMAGLAGGVTLAAVAGARRTSSSYDRLRTIEDGAEVFLYASRQITPEELAKLRAIPKAKVGASTIILLLSAATGIDRRNDLGIIVASDEESLAMLRPHHLKGRMPSPDHPEEILVNELVASELQLRPGDSVDLIGPSPAAFACIEALECDGQLASKPISAVVSGVVRESGDLDPDAFNGALVYAGPGMDDLAPEEYVRALTVADVKLDDGFAGADTFTAELEKRFPPQEEEGQEQQDEVSPEDAPVEFGFEIDDPNESNIDGTLDVEARSLLVFALFSGVAGLVATTQAFARHLGAGRNERRVLAALGLTARDRTVLIMRTGLLVVGAGTVLAIVVAVLGSAFLPVGVAGRAEPYPGIDIDEIVLGAGGGVMATVLLLSFAGLAWRASRRDGTGTAGTVRGRAGRLAGLPLVPALGVDLAAPRVRRGAASTAGAVVSVIAALAATTAAVVVSASNHRLQATPQLYGEPWDANAALGEETARPVADGLLANPALSALAIAKGGGFELAGPTGKPVESMAVAIDLLKGEMEPAILAGRAPRSPDEVALGSKLFDELDVAIGDSVTAGDGAELRVVGRVIVPIVSADFPDQSALLTIPGFERHASLEIQGESPEVHVAFDVRPGADLYEVLDHDLGPAIALVGAPARKPSDVTTLAGIGRFPGAIGLFTAVLAVAALVHALLVVARRRRRDLVTLRALGLRRRQGAATVLWAAAAVFGVGVLVGVPLGLAIGRLVWQAIADSISVVNSAAVPGLPLVLVVAAGALATVAAAAWPALGVRRVRLADALRAE